MPGAIKYHFNYPGWITLVCSLLLFCGCDKCNRLDSDDPFAKARCRIEELMAEKNIASFQVAVARDGELIFEEAFGLANVERQIPTTTETMHLVASIEKPFVSTALMILAEQGRINLQAPVNDYLGESKLIAYQGNAADATVARLLLHTTGLPYGYYIAGDEIPQEQKRTNQDLVDLAGVLVTAPGTRFQYTNTGYGLFNDIVGAVADENIKKYITREIITPLGLKHTQFFTAAPSAELITTQNADDGVLPIAFDAEGYTALYSTAGDLARFGMFHLKTYPESPQPILSDSSIDMLWQYQDTGVKYTTRRLAWDVQHEFGIMVLQHGGGGPGIHNRLYLIPSENVAVAIMNNAYYPNYWSDPILADLIGAAVSPSSSFTHKRITKGVNPRWPKLDPTDYRGKWTGQKAYVQWRLISTPTASPKYASPAITVVTINGFRHHHKKPRITMGHYSGDSMLVFPICIHTPSTMM